MSKLLIAVLIFASLLNAAITIDNHALAASSLPTSTTLTFTSYITGANSTLMVVVVPNYCGAANGITSVTWNTSSSLTKAIKENDGTHAASVEIWYLINPTPATANVVITFNACTSSTNWGALVITFKGTATVNPLYGVTGSIIVAGTSISDSVSVVTSGDYLLDGVSVNVTTGATPNASQTKYGMTEAGTVSDASSRLTTGTGSTSMSWTYLTSSGANAHAVVGIAQPQVNLSGAKLILR